MLMQSLQRRLIGIIQLPIQVYQCRVPADRNFIWSTCTRAINAGTGSPTIFVRGFLRSALVGRTGCKEEYQTQYDERSPDYTGSLLLTWLNRDLAGHRSCDGENPKHNSSHHQNGR